MNGPRYELAPILSMDDYHEVMCELDSLMRTDPALDSAEGIRLRALADAAEAWERRHWPDMFPERDHG